MISCSQHRVGRARKLKSGCEFPALLACFPLQAARKRSELRAVLMAPVARAVGLCRAVIGPATTASRNIVLECLFSSENDMCLCNGMAFVELAELCVFNLSWSLAAVVIARLQLSVQAAQPESFF